MKNNCHKIAILLSIFFITIAFAGQDNKDLRLPALTPVPATIAGIDRNVVSLDGQWMFTHAQNRDSLNENWSNITVPGQWLQQGFRIDGKSAGYYRKIFSVPAAWGNMRIKLRCDGIYSQSKIWINDKFAGEHVGGFTAFEFDVTDCVKPGDKNQIDVEVKTESLANVLAAGTRYAAHDIGGITRKIYLFAVPKVHISSVQLQTAFDAEYKNARLKMAFAVTNNTEQPVKQLQIRFKIKDSFNKSAKTTASVIKLDSIAAGATIRRIEEIDVVKPAKWDCEHPNLYNLFYTVYADGKKLTQAKETFGFRDVQIRDKNLFVNGKALKLRGICRHEAHPLLGRSLTPPLWEKDVRLLKEANINFIRTSHYPPAEEFIEACDRHGIFVEEEAPFCWAGLQRGNPDWKDYAFEDETVKELVLQQTLEMVQRDKNHPSVIMWSLANESKWSGIFENSGKALRAFDPTRPVKFTNPPDNGFCEMEVQHYPGPGGPQKYSTRNRPVIFSEYCHLNTYNRREIFTDPGLHDYWGGPFSSMWNKMYETENIIGGSIWAGVSDTFYVRNSDNNVITVGYGDWGPLDGWRRQKPEYWHIKKTYSPIKLLEDKISPAQNRSVRIKLRNNYDFSNLNELRIEVTTPSKTLVLKADIEPGREGYLDVPLKMLKNADSVQLIFLHKQGFMVDTFELPVVNRENKTPKEEKTISAAPEIINEGNNIVITGSGFQWHFDSSTGLLEKAVIGSKEVKIAGPVLTITPLFGAGGSGQITEQTIEVLNGELTNFHPLKIETLKTAAEAIIQVRGEYDDDAEGSYTMAFDADGRGKIEYNFTYQEEISPREIGATFTLDRDFDLLSWDRKSQWSVYPDNHIGRPRGTAKALPYPNRLKLPVNHQPDWLWYEDASEAGTNDFRSSKYDINYASLTNTDGIGLKAISNGEQASRSYIEDGSIKWLIADYSNGGMEPFFKPHLESEYKPLKKGDVVRGTVVLELVVKKQ